MPVEASCLVVSLNISCKLIGALVSFELPANTDAFPVAASLHQKNNFIIFIIIFWMDGEKRQPEIRLCSQAIFEFKRPLH